MSLTQEIIFGGSKVKEYPDDFYNTLQQAKEMIGRFADGSNTSHAKIARELWEYIDIRQQYAPPK